MPRLPRPPMRSQPGLLGLEAEIRALSTPRLRDQFRALADLPAEFDLVARPRRRLVAQELTRRRMAGSVLDGKRDDAA